MYIKISSVISTVWTSGYGYLEMGVLATAKVASNNWAKQMYCRWRNFTVLS